MVKSDLIEFFHRRASAEIVGSSKELSKSMQGSDWEKGDQRRICKRATASSKYLLSIDASLPTPFLLLAQDKEILDYQELDSRSSEQIASTTANLLKNAGLKPGDLTDIAAGIGPGSYTGIRAALSFAQALAFGLGITPRGFCALAALAPSRPGTFAVAIDARSAGIWGAFATPSEGLLSPPEKVPSEEIAAWAQGPVWSLTPEKISSKGPIKTLLSRLNPLVIREISCKANLPLTPNYLGKGVAPCQPPRPVLQ